MAMLTNYRPFSPHAQVIASNEIKVQWLPMRPKKGVHIYYQLFNGEELEYVGQDLFHVAKRLHTGEEYKFQVQVCNSLISGDCSQLSFPRYQTLSGEFICSFYAILFLSASILTALEIS